MCPMAHHPSAALSSRLPSSLASWGWRDGCMERPQRRASERGRDNHAWDDERMRMVGARLAYLRTYSEQFHRLFGRAPSESDLERAVEQYEPDQGFWER